MKSQPGPAAEPLNASSVVASRNGYRFGGWTLLFNSAKNAAKFEFEEASGNALRIKVRGSTSWIRLLRPLPRVEKDGIYTLSLTVRALTENAASTYTAHVFRQPDEHRFEKLCRLNGERGTYAASLALAAEGPALWTGFETVDSDIDLYVSYVRLEMTEGSRQMIEGLKRVEGVALPIRRDEPKAKTYRTLRTWSAEFQTCINNGETAFLLDYAAALRSVEMPESWVRLVRYLIVKYGDMTREQRKKLAAQVARALVTTRDLELVSLMDEHCPELMLQLDMNSRSLSAVAGIDLPRSAEHGATLDKHDWFVLQHEPERLLQRVHQQVLHKPDYVFSEPRVHCAAANAYASRVGHEKRYASFVNRFLADSGVSDRIASVRFDAQPALGSMRFRPSEAVRFGPLVSVIMSAYEASDTIGYAMRSLLEQSYRNIEILVCDDGSSDATLAIARNHATRDPRVRVFRSRHNQGTYNIRNDLLREARGEYITFQDSDDLALPRRIETQLEALATERKAICFSRWVRIRPNGSFVFFHDGAVARFCVVSALAHRSVFERLPPFRPSLVAADTEFYEQCRYFLGDGEIAQEARPLILGLWGDGSLTRAPDLTADDSGFVAPRRRAYGEVAARQRVLGATIVTDADVVETLTELGIHRVHTGIEPVGAAEDVAA